MARPDVRVEFVCVRCNEPIPENTIFVWTGEGRMHELCHALMKSRRENVLPTFETARGYPFPDLRTGETCVRCDMPILTSDQTRETGDGLAHLRCYPMGEESLEDWWIRTVGADMAKTTPKTQEYGGVGDGSSDLRTMGYALAELCGMHDAPEPVKLELACWFYATGKLSRLISDYKQGKPGKPDTWFDLSVYAMMARRIQETGDWP